jgi:hypothetical protein
LLSNFTVGNFEFPTGRSFVVIKRQFATKICAAQESELDAAAPVTVEKRQCIRSVGEMGELEDETWGKFRGMSTHLLNLNG